jgi:DNA-binding Lrp family transcriptional regulator
MDKREYKRLRAKGWTADQALRAAKVLERFRELEAEGLVRFSAHEDPEPYEHGDVGDEQETNERIEALGVWGIVSERYCAVCEHWTPVDSVWGFIGDDWKDSGYDTDVKLAAIDAIRDAAERVSALDAIRREEQRDDENDRRYAEWRDERGA